MIVVDDDADVIDLIVVHCRNLHCWLIAGACFRKPPPLRAFATACTHTYPASTACLLPAIPAFSLYYSARYCTLVNLVLIAILLRWKELSLHYLYLHSCRCKEW